MQDRVFGETTVDSRQQLVEIITLACFLRERRKFLERKAQQFAVSQSESRELTTLREALVCPEHLNGSRPNPAARLHSTEAGLRLRAMVKNRLPLTKADLAQIAAMVEFPEDNNDIGTARRAAYLRALQILEIASLREIQELDELVGFASAANS